MGQTLIKPLLEQYSSSLATLDFKWLVTFAKGDHDSTNMSWCIEFSFCFVCT